MEWACFTTSDRVVTPWWLLMIILLLSDATQSTSDWAFLVSTATIFPPSSYDRFLLYCLFRIYRSYCMCSCILMNILCCTRERSTIVLQWVKRTRRASELKVPKNKLKKSHQVTRAFFVDVTFLRGRCVLPREIQRRRSHSKNLCAEDLHSRLYLSSQELVKGQPKNQSIIVLCIHVPQCQDKGGTIFYGTSYKRGPSFTSLLRYFSILGLDICVGCILCYKRGCRSRGRPPSLNAYYLIP